MKTNRILNQLLATTMICGAAISFASPAYAQDTDEPSTGPVENADTDVSADADTATQDQGDILVTGSRIPQPNLTSTSPVTVLNSQEVKITGTTRAEDLLNSLPQVFAGQSSTIANGASGTATVNLRGLGSERTLVLVNGRRLLPGDPFSSAADINAIPAAMIRRVDVLTGGASSVYGADAVGGVVNFIMDTDFEGIRIDGQYSFYQHENGAREPIRTAIRARNFALAADNVAGGGTTDITLSIGAGFDDGRGHVSAFIGYRDVNQILQSKYDYSGCALNARTDAAIAAAPVGPGGVTEFACGGSGTSRNGTFLTNVGNFQIGPNRTLIPGSTPYNFGPLNHYQRPDERYIAGAFAKYEISGALKPYLEFMFMDDKTVAQIAPSGDFFSTTTVNCDNPLLSAQQRAGQFGGRGRGQRSGRLPRPERQPVQQGRRLYRPPQRRGRRSPGHPAAHLLPRRRRHEGRPGQHLVLRHLLPVRPGQFRRDLSQRLLGDPPEPRHRRRRRSEPAGRQPGLPVGPRRHRSELRPLGHLRAELGYPGRVELPPDPRLPARLDRGDHRQRLA
jgi:hypothetical protein